MKVGATIFEGLTLSQVHYYTNVPVELLQLSDYRDKYDFLADIPQYATSLEGYLFPDTYYFNYGDTAIEVAKTMLANFGEKLTSKLRSEIKNQGKTIYEIVTMASLIEKEAATDTDRKLISGVLWKRLDAGMRLQVDATVLYATGKTGSVSIEDTKTDSPYNTYMHAGLPAGPICSPSLNSILAAIYPQDSPYWYYLATPEGKTIFSKTLEEHNAAKYKYLK
jgi:UPF0755 protein